MIPDLLALPHVERLGWVLLHALWQGALVAMVLHAVLDALRDRSADLRYAACLTALILLVALPTATWLVLKPTTADIAAAPQVAEEERLRQSAPLWAAVVASSAAQQALDVQRPEAQPWWRAAEARLRPMLPYVVFGWALGVVVLSLRMLGGWMQVQALRRHGLRAVPERWTERFEEVARRLGIARPVELWASVRVDVPLTVGVLRPLVLVPVGFLTGLPPEQVEAVLAHELAHVRRYDYLVNLLQAVVETLLFFHPAAWWVSRQLRAEREFACDDRAVAACRDHLVYARALTGVAELRGAGAWLAPAAADGSLSSRIRRLVAPAESTEVPWGRVAVAGVALLVTLAVVVGACAPRPVEGEKPSERNRAPVMAEQAAVVAEPDSPTHIYRAASMRGDAAEPDVLVVRSDTDSVDVEVHVERLRRRADSLREQHEVRARRMAREMDNLHGGVFRLRVDSLAREASRLARWHVDSLRDAGFFARFDTLRLPHFDADYDFDFDFDFDSLAGPHIFFADSLTFRFDSLFAHHDPGAFMLRLDSLQDGFAWNTDSIRVIFRRHEGRMREHEKRMREEMRAREPDHLREQAERLEREAERLRRRAEELEDQ